MVFQDFTRRLVLVMRGLGERTESTEHQGKVFFTIQMRVFLSNLSSAKMA